MVDWKDEQSGYDILGRRNGGSEITMLVLNAQKGMKAEADKELMSR